MINWEAIGAVGEVTGAFAVVVTLIYLVKQLRENTSSNRTNASWSMMQSFNQMHETVVASPQFSEAVRKAFLNQPLTPNEATQINSMMLHYLNTLVAADESYRSGQLSKELWQWIKKDLEWTLQGSMRSYLINHLKIVPEPTVIRLYGASILQEVQAAGERNHVAT